MNPTPIESHYSLLREQMVDCQIKARGIKDERVLDALRKVPRHCFIPTQLISEAYADYPLPIGEGQTISQPYIVAFMSEQLEIEPDHKILEIGTGSGYQTAVLAELTPKVYSVEYYPQLADQSARRLHQMGYLSVKVRQGNGYQGWPEEAPFNGIILTCAPPEIPMKLAAQLAEGGKMILPLGYPGLQDLILIKKQKGALYRKSLLSVAFVPMLKGEKT